ncbi:MAG TPA: chemotaxis protein CheA [bacterium]|nr:chemotaxis protein CheA [bacterium]
MVGDIPIDEFLGEAEDIVDSLNRDLLAINEAVSKKKKFDPALINNIFRAAHSLKGISGLFGFTELTGLAHTLESLLDRLRLGKVELTDDLLDLLFESADMLRAIVAGKGKGQEAPNARDVDELIERLESGEPRPKETRQDDVMSCVGLDILAVLTEYEEHRLHENIKDGMHIIKIRAAFDLATFDEGLTELQALAKQQGEIITTLPSAEESSEDKITFDLIIGTERPLEVVKESLSGRSLTFTLLREGSRAAASQEEGPAPAREEEGKEENEPGAEEAAAEPKEAPPREAGDAGASLRTISQTVRVDIGKLDNLMNIVGELVIAKNIMTQLIERLRAEMGFTELSIELVKNTRTMERKLSELQSGVLEVRMVPVGQIFDKLHRNVRKLSRELEKEIEFVAEGGDTELDKLIIEDLADPLMHIIRNALDHGIEVKAERIQLGKPAKGLIRLRAFQRGNHVVIEIYDDGAGINYDRIKRKAVEMGFFSASAEPRADELIECLFAPGFSTASKVSEISGRGVGLDVVKQNISALSGAIDVESRQGEGAKFTITLPITLAIIQALIVEAGGQTFAIPLNSVQQGLMIQPREIQTIEGREVIELRGKTLPLLRLDKLFGLTPGGNGGKGSGRKTEAAAGEDTGKDVPADARENGEAEKEGEGREIYVVKVGIADRGLGIIVDRLWGRQDIVIKSVGEVLKGIKGIAGATELGNQRTILVLDVMDLMEEAAVSMFSANK